MATDDYLVRLCCLKLGFEALRFLDFLGIIVEGFIFFTEKIEDELRVTFIMVAKEVLRLRKMTRNI